MSEPQIYDRMKSAEAKVEEQAQTIQQMGELLRSLEWIGDGPTALCWRCGRQRCNGHNPVCQLDAALNPKEDLWEGTK